MSLHCIAGRFLLFLTCSLCVSGQSPFDRNHAPELASVSNDPFAPPSSDPFAGASDSEIGERPHTRFERLQRTLANSPTFPSTSEQPRAAGTVSVSELRSAPAKTELSLLQRAARYAQSGDHDTAIRVLKRGLAESRSMPHALGMLGTEYLKTGDIEAAITKLKKAVELGPSVAVNYSNLGYALCRIGDFEGAERVVREAIRLNRSSPKPHFLLGIILLDRGAPEAHDELLMAQNQVNSARLALAIYHEHRGETEEAQRQIKAFLRADPSADSRGTQVWVASVASLERPAVAFGFPSARE